MLPYMRDARVRLGRWVPGLALLRPPAALRPATTSSPGVVLAALLVPQGMAYAELAGLPPVTGLYATLVPLVATSCSGPSRILVLGPDSAVSPLVAAAIVPLAATRSVRARSRWPAMLALLVGALMFAGGSRGSASSPTCCRCRSGSATSRASRSTVIVAQLPKLFGFSVDAENFIPAVRDFVAGLDQTERRPRWRSASARSP